MNAGTFIVADKMLMLQLTIEIGDNVRDHNKLLGDMVL